MISPVLADGQIPFNGDAVQAFYLVGSQGDLLCLPGPEGPFSRQVDGSRLVRRTGELVRSVGSSAPGCLPDAPRVTAYS